MAVKIACPNPECRAEYKVQQESLGGRATCKKCGTTFTLQLSTGDTVAPHPVAAVRPAAPAPRPPQPGAVVPLPKIGRYVVKRRLGAGAMGEVWLARDPDLERDVAIKTLRREYAQDPDYLRRFLREARSAAQLHHQNTVSIYQVGAEKDVAFIAMEMVEGNSLDKVLKERGPLPWREATQIIRDAALGLAVAHEIGVVHRDLKPANLMHTSKGVTKVVDFGLARAGATDSQITQKGAMLGTPAFMAPELWAGESADARSDLYALVISYYCLLTNKLPYEAEMLVQVGYQHRYEPFPDPRAHVAGLPDAVCRILARGARKEPGERYPNAAALVAELDALLASPADSLTLGAAWQEFNDPQAGGSAPGTVVPVGTVVRAIPLATAPPAFDPMSSFDGIASTGSRAASSTRAGRNRQATLSAFRRKKLWIGGAVGLLLLGSLAAGAVMLLRVKTPDGVIALEVNEPNPEVLVDGDRVTVSWDKGGTKAEIRVLPGSRKIELQKDGFKAIGEELLIEHGGRRLLAAKFEALPSKVSRDIAPLADQPALPALIPGMPIDLLKLIDPARDAIRGDWHWRGRELISPNVRCARVQIPYAPPADYELTVNGERKSGDEPFAIGAVIGSKPVMAIFDAYHSSRSGLELVDGNTVARNPTTKQISNLLKIGQPYSVICVVHPHALSIAVNDMNVLEWTEGPERFSVHPDWRVPQEERLSVGTYESVHNLRSLTLVPLVEPLQAAAQLCPLAVAAVDGGRQPVPDSAAQKQAAEAVRAVFSDELSKSQTPAEKVRLAALLLTTAAESKDPAQEYALLSEARDLAIAGGSANVAIRVACRLAQRFKLDGGKTLADSLEGLTRGSWSAAVWSELACDAISLAYEAAAGEQFELAHRLDRVATTAADKSGQSKWKSETAAVANEIVELEKDAQAAKDAKGKLKASPDDAAAHLALGKHLCFGRGDWNAGLVQLLHGSDPTLKALAKRECAVPTAANDQVALADAWWSLAEKSQLPAQLLYRRRAAWWYEQGKAGATGLAKAEVNHRLHELVDKSPGILSQLSVGAFVAGRSSRFVKEVFLSDLELLASQLIVDSHGGFRLKSPVVVNGTKSPHGIWLHPPGPGNSSSHTAFALGGLYARFEGKIALSDGKLPGADTPYTFRIVGDGRELWKSEPIRKSAPREPQPFQVNVAGVQRLDLFVDCPGSYEWAFVVCVEPKLTIDPEQLPAAAGTAAVGAAIIHPPAIAPFDARQARAHQEAWAKRLGMPVEQTNSIGMKLALIPPGEFMMGSPANEPGRNGDEPQYWVRITRPFYLGQTEVTQGQWESVMHTTPWKGIADVQQGSDYPAEHLSYDDAVAFCRELSRRDNRSYRLPTEAEWEYSCRAGTTGLYSFGDDVSQLEHFGWFDQNAANRGNRYAHRVGQKRPNPFGLYDMHGNLREWCSGWHENEHSGPSPVDDPNGPSAGSLHLDRGSSWGDSPRGCRSAHRGGGAGGEAYPGVGLRILTMATNASAPARTTRSGANVSEALSAEPRLPPSSRALRVGTAPAPAIAPFDAKKARAHQEAWAKHLGEPVEQTNSIGMKLVLIPPGAFLMGATSEQTAAGRKMGTNVGAASWEFQRLKEEGPQHRVTLAKPNRIGMTEVTVGEFTKFVDATKYVTEAERFGFGDSDATKLDDNVTPQQRKTTWRTPGYAVTTDLPVTQVTWNDAVQFCNWLSDQEKLKPCYQHGGTGGWILLTAPRSHESSAAGGDSRYGYRLPTEAEWEYACRAGTTTQFSFGDDPAMLGIYGWFNKNAGHARPVGSKVANPFGLYDMRGNVYEWCQDWYSADYYSKSSPADPLGPSSGFGRVTRSGRWRYDPVPCRSAFRGLNTAVDRDNDLGFRVVRVSTGALAPPAAASPGTKSK